MKEYLNKGASIYFADGRVVFRNETIAIEDSLAKRFKRKLVPIAKAKTKIIKDTVAEQASGISSAIKEENVSVDKKDKVSSSKKGKDTDSTITSDVKDDISNDWS